jgi:hypothetical protein
MQEIALSVRVEPSSASSGSHPIIFSIIDAENPATHIELKASFWMP